MGILNVDNIQPVGGGTTITLNSSEINVGTGITFESNGQANFAGIVTATSFVGDGIRLTGAGPTLTNGSNNRVVTATGANGINGEANLTFDGDNLTITGSNHVTQILKAGGATSDLHIDFKDSSNNLEARIFCASDQGDLRFYTGGANERLRIGSSGQIGIAGANYGTSGQVLKSQGASSAVQWASPSLAMADQWRVSTSQTTSSDTIADITGWSRNNNNFAGVGGALTNSGANFTFPSTGIYYISYNIATYITSGSSRYISARLYYNGQDICHSWASSYHASGNQTTQSTGSQAIINVTNTATQTFKIRIQSQNPVVVVGLNEAGYNSSVNMSEVVVMRIGDT